LVRFATETRAASSCYKARLIATAALAKPLEDQTDRELEEALAEGIG
jgi:hypothetical protein